MFFKAPKYLAADSSCESTPKLLAIHVVNWLLNRISNPSRNRRSSAASWNTLIINLEIMSIAVTGQLPYHCECFFIVMWTAE